MRLFPRRRSTSSTILGKFVGAVFLPWIAIALLSIPARAENPVSEFFSALKDGQDAGRVEAAQYGFRQAPRSPSVSAQYLNAAEAVAQRLVNQLSAKHPGSQTFAWMANHTKDAILSNPSSHASDLQAAANLIYAEAAREAANPATSAANPAATTGPNSQAEIPHQLPPLPARQPASSPALPIFLVLLAAVIAGALWLKVRRRKATKVSYVEVKSPVPAADASQTAQTFTANRGADGR